MKRLCALAVAVLAVPSLQSGGRADAAGSGQPETKIAFVSDRDGNREIYIMNADGSGQTNLTNNAAEDLWATFSPDGSKIAFYSERDVSSEIYVMDADGANQTKLTNNPSSDFRPVFSPDGTRIIFESFYL